MSSGASYYYRWCASAFCWAPAWVEWSRSLKNGRLGTIGTALCTMGCSSPATLSQSFMMQSSFAVAMVWQGCASTNHKSSRSISALVATCGALVHDCIAQVPGTDCMTMHACDALLTQCEP